MARIRTIKPEFWVDEKVVELSPWARLLFIGLWNFVDDEGRCEYKPKKIKMQIFPADTVDIDQCLNELSSNGLVSIYKIAEHQFLQVVNFNVHQKIDKRSASKIPPPEGLEQLKKYEDRKIGFVYALKQRGGSAVKIGKAANAEARTRAISGSAPFPVDAIGVLEADDMSALESAIHRHFAEHRVNGEWFELGADSIEKLKQILETSESARRILGDYSANGRRTVPTEGKGRDQGMEGKGEEEEAGKPATPGCPHQEIIALYHELLPLCPRVKVWNETRQGYLRARWRERDKNQSLDFWRDYFTHVSKSKFLTGQANGRPGMPPFVADLEWLIKPENFAKVLEGKYDREAA